MKNSTFGFSIIEIIITVAILIILGVVATTSYQSVLDKSNNSLVESHLQTLKNTFLGYTTETKLLPTPSGNLKFYNIDGAYEHNFEDENTFGVSGYITNENIPKAYLQTTPIDPRSNQYYGYAQTKNYDGFQIAGVVLNNHQPQAKLISNWEGVSGEKDMYLPFLVKEYNGPRFIIDNSLENFPYNPEENLLTAKIQSYTGSVSINGQSVSNQQILNSILQEGDSIKVGAGGYVDIYYSDGSYSALGDANQESELKFTQMRYLEKNNLFTHVRVMLNAGSIWTKATKLADKSEFEVETSGAVAAVRGTIFGITKTSNSTNIILKEGKIEVLLKQNNQLIPFEKPGITTLEDGKHYVIVNKSQPEKGIQIPDNNTGGVSGVSSGTGGINNIPTQKKNEFLEYREPTKISEKIGETNGCEIGWEKVIDECVEFIQEDDELVKTQTGAALFEFYKDVLQRKPDRKGFLYWLSEIEKKGFEKIKLPFKIDGYYSKLNGREKYFNPEYICEAQQSFKIDFECVDNTLFKDEKDWKVLGFSPFDRDMDMRTNSFSLISTGKYRDSNLYYSNASLSASGCNGEYVSTSGTFKNQNQGLRDVKAEELYPGDLQIYQLGEVKGLFLDNLHCDDNVKYDLGGLKLNPNQGFAIEMNVRGQALKREDIGQYRLFTTEGLSLEKNNTANNRDLKFNFGKNYILLTKDLLDKLSNTEFYKVVAGYDGVRWFIKIFDAQNNLSLSVFTKDGFGEIPQEIKMLYIASTEDLNSKNVFKHQWNDMVDYVKIYSK